MSKKTEMIIEKIVETIRKAHSKGLILDDKKFAFEICANTYCSERKAKEYLKIARVIFARQLNSK